VLDMPNRRTFLLGVGASLATPALVRFESLMPVRNRLMVIDNWPDWIFDDPFEWRRRYARAIYLEYARYNRFQPYAPNP
jgi:hypothetical protein